ncbi:MAG: hypothetical protein AAGD07_18555 [Planctomycetota bacterium]
MTGKMNELGSKAKTRRRFFAVTMGALVGGTLAKIAHAIDPLIPHFSYTFGGLRRCLPRHDYQHKATSPSVIVSSLPVVEFTSPMDDVRATLSQTLEEPAPSMTLARHLSHRRKRFRPNRASMMVDHCRISDIVIDFTPHGYWWLSVKAEQNPPVEADEDRNPISTIHLKRNAFQFAVRLYASGNRPITEMEETDNAFLEPNPGRLLVCEIRPTPFVVHRATPRHLNFRGVSTEIEAYYPSIASAEFEFRYEHDPLSAAGESVRRLQGP